MRWLPYFACLALAIVAVVVYLWLRRRGKAVRSEHSATRQAVVLRLRLPLCYDGHPLAVEDIRALEVIIDQAVRADGVGEFSRDEFEGANCNLYFYGAYAQLLWKSVRTALDRVHRERRLRYGSGSTVELRFGSTDIPVERQPIS